MPRTKEMASILKESECVFPRRITAYTYELDLPEPLGPMMEVKKESPKSRTW